MSQRRPATLPSRARTRWRALRIAVAGVALVGMAAVEAWQVFARYVLNDSPSWTEPVALLLHEHDDDVRRRGRRAREPPFRLLHRWSSARAPRVAPRCCSSSRALIAAAIGVLFALWGGEMLIDAWDYPDGRRAAAAGHRVPAAVPRRRADRAVRARAADRRARRDGS